MGNRLSLLPDLFSSHSLAYERKVFLEPSPPFPSLLLHGLPSPSPPAVTFVLKLPFSLSLQFPQPLSLVLFPVNSTTVQPLEAPPRTQRRIFFSLHLRSPPGFVPLASHTYTRSTSYLIVPALPNNRISLPFSARYSSFSPSSPVPFLPFTHLRCFISPAFPAFRDNVLAVFFYLPFETSLIPFSTPIPYSLFSGPHAPTPR